MSRNVLIATTIALSSLSGISSALDSAAPSSTGTVAPTEMSKDSWLNNMAPLLPDLICKGFIQDAELKKRFDEIKMSYEQCVTLIPESTKKCQAEIYPNIPEKVNGDSAAIWGKALGECIGKDFAIKYLVPKS